MMFVRYWKVEEDLFWGLTIISQWRDRSRGRKDSIYLKKNPGSQGCDMQ